MDKDTNHMGVNLPAAHERFIYVLPEEAIKAIADDEVSLLDLWRILWRGKWLLLGITGFFCALSIAHALTSTEWYEAQVLSAPAESRSGPTLPGALGGLASLAGVSGGGGNEAEAIAILRSRDFTRAFITDTDLLPHLFPDAWDEQADSWSSESGIPDIRDSIRYFDDNIRTVIKDQDTGLVTLAVEWKDPVLAADWANLLAERLNERMRQEALADAEGNLAYLQAELGKTNVVTLQQSIGRLMESELQKLMLARGNEEFAFNIIDRAQVPIIRSRPKRTLIVVVWTIIGGALSVLLVLLLHNVRTTNERAADSRH